MYNQYIHFNVFVNVLSTNGKWVVSRSTISCSELEQFFGRQAFGWHWVITCIIQWVIKGKGGKPSISCLIEKCMLVPSSLVTIYRHIFVIVENQI